MKVTANFEKLQSMRIRRLANFYSVTHKPVITVILSDNTVIKFLRFTVQGKLSNNYISRINFLKV